MASSSAASGARSEMSSANVSSELIDFVSLSVATGESSSPRARRRSATPHGPSAAVSASGEPCATCPSVSNPCAFSRFADCGPTPGRARTSRSARKRASSPGSITTNPAGLPDSHATLATILFAATPTEHGSPTSTRMRPCIRRATPRRLAHRPRDRREVDVRLVHRHLLHEFRFAPQDVHHPLRVRPVEIEPGPHHHRVRTQPHGLRHRHRRPASELAGRVRRRRHYPARRRAPADQQRLAGERGVLSLLYGGVEGIEVYECDVALICHAQRIIPASTGG